MANEFKNIFKKIEKAINTSKTQALNKAAKATNTLYAKEVSKALGIPSATVKKRAKIIKATNKNQSVTLSIGVKKQIAAHNFKTGQTKIDTRAGTRYAANYRINGTKKELPKGAFLTKTNTNKSTKNLILQRTGESRYPVKTVLVDELRPVVESIKDDLQDKMNDEFEKNFKSQLKYNVNK